MPWVPSQGVEAVGEAVAGYASMPLEAVAAVAPLRWGVGGGVRVVEPQGRRGVVQAPLARGCGARRGGPATQCPKTVVLWEGAPTRHSAGMASGQGLLPGMWV